MEGDHKTLFSSRVSIQVNSDPPKYVDAFPYLCCTIVYNNSDWEAVYHDLWKARRHWEMISKVLTKTGAKVQAHDIIYISVEQTVLLYGCESWLVTVAILELLEVSRHQASQKIAEITDRRMEDGEC